MASKTEKLGSFEFVVSEQPGSRSRDLVTVLSGQGALSPGAVLGRATIGAVGTPTAVAGNTGNGTFGTVTVATGVQAGVYNVRFTAATKFIVEAPDGVTSGVGTTGVAFTFKGLTFTITAGGTAFGANDAFTITVAAGSGKYKVPDVAAVDGSNIASAILGVAVDATSGDAIAPAIVRAAEVNQSELSFGSLDANGIAAAIANLSVQSGIIVRGAA